MEELLNQNSKLIYSMTHYFENYRNVEDLFQVGCIGLIKAYNKFDDSLGVKFSTYAYPYILGEMKKLIREDKSLKINRDILKLSKKIEEVKNTLSQHLMHEPTSKELSDFLEIDEYYIEEAQRVNNCVDSLDYVLNDEGKEMTLYDLIGNQEDIDTMLDLKNELSNLTTEEQKLIMERYSNDLSQQETAKILGINQVQVSRKEQKILTKLRNKLTV